MNVNSNALTIFEPQNVQTIAELAPQSYHDNIISHDRCLDAGNILLQRIQLEGMSDALDMEIAKFIEKAKATVRKMNGKRTPVTQLFDQIRKVYTSMENDVDPAKTDSVPAQLQAHRNAYAKKKHDEEERRRREEAARIAKENAKNRYRTAVEDDFVNQFNAHVNKSINELNEADRRVTLDNYNIIFDAVKEYICELPDSWLQKLVSGTLRPAELSPDECRAIQAGVLSNIALRFKEQFPFEVQTTRDEILDRLPSKKKELERIAKTSADEAARIKAEMEAKERADAARKEAERLEREQQEAAAKALAAQKQEMESLFDTPAQAVYQPKTSVKKKVVISSPDDIMLIVGYWWAQEGCHHSVDDLCREFKKQITFVNAAANSKDNPAFIDNLRYDDDIKAK